MLRPATGKRVNVVWRPCPAAKRNSCKALSAPCNTPERCTARAGYLLDSLDTAEALLEHNPTLKLQLDLYHLQIIRGDLSMLLRRLIPTGRVGHIQIAGVPDRHEPDTGEVNYPHLFRLLDDLGYNGWIGCEYRPARGQAPHATRDGLGWMTAWL